MEVNRKDNCFYLGPNFDERIGEIVFHFEGDDIVVTHTFVDPSYRGLGLAGKLVDAVVSLARNARRMIIPVCPYVKKVLENGDFEDVLKKSEL